MPFLTQTERDFLAAVSRVGYCNPFLPERITFERDALGDDFSERLAAWNLHPNLEKDSPNLIRLKDKVERLAPKLAARLAGGAKPTPIEMGLYEDGVLFLLYHRYHEDFHAAMMRCLAAKATKQRIGFYSRFVADARGFFDIPGYTLPTMAEVPTIFAFFFQLRRAFYHTFSYIIGVSGPAVRLRAEVWRSIFTHDLRRYRRSLFTRMGDITTLITGATGTGKELVARAIGLSRFIPFRPESQTFAAEFAASFFALNLSAMAPTLIESELFGHRRGAFTGAVEDRTGWLEVCPPNGTVFLDEIGDLDASIQVKLLRVLQERTFQRLGETRDRTFTGKIIAATNRDLSSGADDSGPHGGLRADFYYRICADTIATPSLCERLRDAPEELGSLLLHLVRREFGDDADAIAAEVEAWVRDHLGGGYPWPGNVRELEQCVRNVVIRQEYRPAPRRAPGPPAELAAAITAGSLTAEEMLRRYCTIVYALTKSYGETARRLGLDRRTVKAKVDTEEAE